MKAGGADVWWSTPAREFLGNSYNPDEYEKVEDILDVWFDSGCTHAFVLETRDTLPRPADQHAHGFARLPALSGKTHHGTRSP